MDTKTGEQNPFDYIQRLSDEEHRMYAQDSLSDSDRKRLAEIEVELDRCWDLLRQRRARRAVGEDPDDAHLRPAGVVENYEG